MKYKWFTLASSSSPLVHFLNPTSTSAHRADTSPRNGNRRGVSSTNYFVWPLWSVDRCSSARLTQGYPNRWRIEVATMVSDFLSSDLSTFPSIDRIHTAVYLLDWRAPTLSINVFLHIILLCFFSHFI